MLAGALLLLLLNALWIVPLLRYGGGDDLAGRAAAPRTEPPAAASGQPAAAASPRDATLVFASSFDAFTPDGFASGSHTWGRSTYRQVTSPGERGNAQLVEVTSGSGGIWFEVPVTANSTYRQAVDLEIVQLPPGARIEMILEWFDASSSLIGYRLMPVGESGPGVVTPYQEADAPPGATTVRFVVNAAGGGTYVLDNARLEVLTTPGSAP